MRFALRQSIKALLGSSKSGLVHNAFVTNHQALLFSGTYSQPQVQGNSTSIVATMRQANTA